MKNLVTFIVPVYNAEKTIIQTIESILSQTITNWELILVDDGSIDNSFNICKGYSYTDERIQAIHIENSGVSVARNTGIKNAKGEWICFVDSDDYIDEKLISTLSDYMLDYDVIGYGIKCFPDNKIIAIDQSISFASFMETKYNFLQLYKASFYNSPCNKLYRKQIIKDFFNSDYTLGEDLLFNLQNIINCERIIILNKCLYYYRRMNTNTLSTHVDEYSHSVQIKLRDSLINCFQSDSNVLINANQIYVDAMIDKIWSLTYNSSYSPITKIQYLKKWVSEGLFSVGTKVIVSGLSNKLMYFCILKNMYNAVIIMGNIRRRVSFLYHLLISIIKQE